MRAQETKENLSLFEHSEKKYRLGFLSKMAAFQYVNYRNDPKNKGKKPLDLPLWGYEGLNLPHLEEPKTKEKSLIVRSMCLITYPFLYDITNPETQESKGFEYPIYLPCNTVNTTKYYTFIHFFIFTNFFFLFFRTL